MSFLANSWQKLAFIKYTNGTSWFNFSTSFPPLQGCWPETVRAPRGHPSLPLWCTGSPRFLNGHRQSNWLHALFSRFWGRKWKQTQTSPWDKSATRPQTDHVHNFRTPTTGTGTDYSAGTACLVLFEQVHFCLCSETPLLVSVGEFPAWKVRRVGKKPS